VTTDRRDGKNALQAPEPLPAVMVQLIVAD
jgi:hypothetical protein